MSLFRDAAQFHMDREEAHRELMALAQACHEFLPFCTKLELEESPATGLSRRAIFAFPNHYGASVVRHAGSYGGNSSENLWELGVLLHGELDYNTPITSDVLPRISPTQVAEILERIKALDPVGPMRVWHIEATEDWGYDTYSGHVVIAQSEELARKLCPNGCEGQDVWLNPKRSTCVELVANDHNSGRVILSSYHAG